MGGDKGVTPAHSGPASPGTTSTPAQANTLGKQLADPIWPLGTPMSMLLFLSTSETSDDIDLANPLISWEDLTFGDWKQEREEDLVLNVPHSVSHGNGSWWMDIKLVKDGGSISEKKIEDIASYRKRASASIPLTIS
jgi:hypothetical protein